MQNEHKIDVTTKCIKQHLDGLLYILKNVRKEPEKVNSDVNKTKKMNMSNIY